MNWDLMFDYIRMVSYSMIMLCSLRGIYHRNFSNLLFVGDIVMALGGLLALINKNFFGLAMTHSADLYVTPAVFIWASIHFYTLIHTNGYGKRI